MFHHLGVVFLSGDALVAAVAALRHDGDEMQAVGLHLETRAALVSVFPCVHSVVGMYGTGKVKGDAGRDKVDLAGGHWWRWGSVPFGAVQLLCLWKKETDRNRR